MVSYEIGMKIMDLEMTERVGRTEYCFHTPLIRHVTGLDPRSDDPDERHRAALKFYQWANYDFLWSCNDGPKPWSELGRDTDMGHSEYVEGGTDRRDPKPCPFKTVDEVLDFDAAEEYGLPDLDDRARYFQKTYEDSQRACPDQVFPGGYYKTIVSGCIQAFGWEMFLAAVGTDPKRFGEVVLEGFFNLTMANVRAWTTTTIKVFVQHDDMVWTQGAIFKPDWYRKYIFPRYKKLWDVLKARGIKVLFCSDGKFTEFIDDIAAAGADGFIFEPLTSLEYTVEKYGKTHVIIGNADCRVLTFGDKQDIENEVRRCMSVGKPCPGFMMAVGNHIPPNVPLDNALYYFELVNKLGRR